MLKRIIPCFLILAILFSLLLPVFVYANVVEDVQILDSLSDMISNNVWSWQYDPNKSYGGCTVAADGNHIIQDGYVSGFDGQKISYGLVSQGECTMCHQGLGQIVAYDKAHGGETGTYQDYVAQNYPANMYSSSGDYLFQVTPDMVTWAELSSPGLLGSIYYIQDFPIGKIYETKDWTVSLVGVNSSGLLLSAFPSGDNPLTGEGNIILYPMNLRASFSVPINGYFTLYSNAFLAESAGDSWSCNLSNPGYLSFGSEYSISCNFISIYFRSIRPFYFIYHLPVYKITPSQEINNNYYVRSSRVGSIAYNIVDSDMQNYYPNVQLFNEETNIYTDPSTGEQQNVQSWTYDYTSRTYHLILEGGSGLDIEFADDSINVKINGEITQKYYYTVEKGEEPGPTPTPQPGGPTPTPDPGTTPTPGPGPEPEDPDGFFAWLKQWLIEFKEWLGDWLDKLFNKEPGDITIDDSDNSVHINDQDDLDYDIYYTDDSGEERKTSLRDILHKFDFLRDIYDIGRDLFSIVGADAAVAHAYNSSGSVDITPYLGDLRTVAAADVMPIAGGTGAPSLKMNLGAAQSHYGFTYGGEIEILDLSWYTPYKATVDNLLSGFLWLFFVWRLFKHAPGIVSGAGMVTDKAEDIHDGKRH